MRVLLAASVGAALLLGPTAQAVPSAGSQVDAETAAMAVFQVPTSAGGYDVFLVAGRPVNGTVTRVRALIARTGRSFTPYGVTLPVSAFSTDGTTATLRTRLAGQPLTIRWRADQSLSTYVGQEDSRDLDTSGWHMAGRGAAASVRLGSITCTALGLLGVEVAHDDGSYGRPLDQALRLPLRQAHCGGVPSESFP